MTVQLIPHPEHPQRALEAVESTIRASHESTLIVNYRLRGDIGSLVVPLPRAAKRRDDLWRTTCFELFVRGRSTAYHEYNFSPSGEWAAYEFLSYRHGRRDISAEISISTICDATQLTVSAAVLIDVMAFEHLALTAVIEEHSGAKSYWSLVHPPGAPDFHHHSCFALRMPDIATE